MEMIKCPAIKLNSGAEMPALGFGTAMLDGSKIQSVIRAAVESGYRMFDSSPLYGNEAEFGDALRSSGIKREEVFIASKLRNSQQKYEDALRAFDSTLKALKTSYLDMYMIYWPCPAYDRYCEAWKALEHLQKEGYVRNIGVSNFLPEHLEKLLGMCEIVPAVNELECNPYFSIAALRNYCGKKGIAVEAWFPLGGPVKKLGGNESSGPRLLTDPLLVELGKKYGKTAAQIVLRWEVQQGIVPLPKSSDPHRIFENINIFDFGLSDEDMYRIDMLNIDLRNGHDPATTNDQF